jgi:sec-independent protein translocase protein TatC
LYKYGESIGVSTFFNISEFIPFIMQFLLVFGFSYQLPIIMCAITQFKIVKPMFWGNNLRYVIIIIVIFAAVITPDVVCCCTNAFALSSWDDDYKVAN